jgi:hypothetical protein
MVLTYLLHESAPRVSNGQELRAIHAPDEVADD